MSILESAIELAEKGFYVFPCAKNTKVPIKGCSWPTEATRDLEKIKSWWASDEFNIGIATEKFKENEALIVIDVDKKELNGFQSLVDFEKKVGQKLPKTKIQSTPSGGMHLIYKSRKAVKQGTSVLGEGVDIRSRGGYIISAPSSINHSDYKFLNDLEETEAPDWLVSYLEDLDSKNQIVDKSKPTAVVNTSLAIRRAIQYVHSLEPTYSGSRNSDGYKIACRLNDMGLNYDQMYSILANEWKCHPQLEDFEIRQLVLSAISYAQKPTGNDTPEKHFEKIEVPKKESEPGNPFEEINKEYFYVTMGGQSRVCYETKDIHGNFHLDKLSIQTFKEKIAAKKILTSQNRLEPLAKVWLESDIRRSYKGVVFIPTPADTSPYYNLWRGFSFEPSAYADKEAALGVDLFLEHIVENICSGDKEHSHWVFSFFAHLLQKPDQKPRVALVLKGRKGTGKNILIEMFNEILGNHGVVVSDKRYLVGNFNSVFENKLLFTLDEAFWSGDKSAEGVLKSLITDKKKMIEHKGLEPYTINSYERIVILGNEEWLVPASEDERRFAVFNVSDKRRGDQEFFGAIREGLIDHGGIKRLLHFFLNYKINADINIAPLTEGIIEQKLSSLNSFQAWWFQCLKEERIIGHNFEDHTWPDEVRVSDLWDSYRRSMDQEGNRQWRPNNISLGRSFPKFAKTCSKSYLKKVEGKVLRVYRFAPIDVARLEWESLYGKMNWDS